ncbi:MAG: DUF1080 domain-containing protein [Acidobacteriota bacterium]|nr:DUF1080 domain-containing protein [Acidobacteriota bacterium]
MTRQLKRCRLDRLSVAAMMVACCALWLVGGGMVMAQTVAPRPLFDGRTFAGWEGDTAKTFRIADGAVVGGTLKARIPRNEFLCTTREYTDFVLRLKFKLLGAGANAGVQIRSARIPGNHEVIGYQADLGDGWWGALYDESRRKRALAVPAAGVEIERTLKRNDWNDYEIRAEGRRIRLAINGRQTVDYTEPDHAIKQSGLICLQIHGGAPSEAWYKAITIEELFAKALTVSPSTVPR